MSFVIKNDDIHLVFSIVPHESDYFIFATNFKRYFKEKLNNEILDDRISEINAIRLPIKKVVKALIEIAAVPSKSSIEINQDKLKVELKVELELNILVNEQTQKSEKVKIYFDMTECKSIEELSKYFVNGLIKSLIEQVAPTKRVSLVDPAFMISSNTIEIYSNDLSNMLGAKTEKDISLSQGSQNNSGTALARRQLKKISSRQMLKPQSVEVKKFEYKEDSQEIDFTEELLKSSSSSSATQISQDETKLGTKRKKPNIKF